jgi:tetratricopeptide (TPR) repeat protein
MFTRIEPTRRWMGGAADRGAFVSVSDHQRSFARLIAGASLAFFVATAPGAPVAAEGGDLRLERLREMPAPASSFAGNFLAAHVANESRDAAAAAVFYRPLLAASPGNHALAENALVAFLAAGDMRYAVQASEQVLEGDPDNGLAQLALAVAEIREGQFPQARARLEQGGRGPSADLTATLLRAWSYAGSDMGDDALFTVDRLAGEPGFELFRQYQGALIASFLNRQDEARQRFSAALEMQPRALSIVDAYARFAARDGRRDDALAAYDAFIAAFQRHPVATANRDALAAGEALPRPVSSVNEGASEVLYALASIGGDGDDLIALIYLNLALHLAPAHDMALMLLADYLRGPGQLPERMRGPDRYAAAIDAYNRVPQSSPLRRSADIEIALLLEQMDRKEEAVAHLEAILERDPSDIEAAQALGSVQRMRSNFEEAAESYTRAINLLEQPASSDWILFFYRGASFERSGEWERAEADLKRALELIPETNARGRAEVLNYIGYSWIDQGMNLEEGYAKIRQAIELAPDSGHIIDSLGWAYYLHGRYEEAVEQLERAVGLLPNDPVINDHLGDAYWKVGRRLEARFQWERALGNDPEPDDRERIERKLESGLDAVEADERKADTEAARPARREGG